MDFDSTLEKRVFRPELGLLRRRRHIIYRSEGVLVHESQGYLLLRLRVNPCVDLNVIRFIQNRFLRIDVTIVDRAVKVT